MTNLSKLADGEELAIWQSRKKLKQRHETHLEQLGSVAFSRLHVSTAIRWLCHLWVFEGYLSIDV